MSYKELESILLSDKESNIEKINEILDINYKETLNNMLDILYDKINSGLKIEVYLILDNIENIILDQDVSNNIIIVSSIRRIVYMLSNKYSCDDTEIKNIKYRLLDIIRKVNIKKDKTDNVNLYSLYYSVIFRERNLDIFELILRQEKTILSKCDNRGNDLFYNVLDYYSQLDEMSISEINYFHDVLMLFIKYKENELVKKSKNYYSLLDREFCKDKKHVIEISRQLYGFSNVDIDLLKKRYNISNKVHEEVMKEIYEFKLKRDDREIIDSKFITIDEEDATCLDDALSMVENKDGSYNYYVAIADIPSIIPYQSKTYFDAYRRNETLYLCDDKVDLYPSIVSHEWCSLLPLIDKNAIVYKFFVDPYFNIDFDSLEIIKGIVRVNKKLSYSQVNKQTGISPSECKMIENMYFLASKLRRLNSKKDEYRKLENIIRSDAVYHHSLFSDKSISANIVQESMLLVNSSAPRYFSKNGFIYNYRNHRFPNGKELSLDLDKLLKMGKSDLDSREYVKLINHIKQLYLCAHYSIYNSGHEGLGYDFYSHSTSSLRRFSDSFNQYLTYFQVFDKVKSDREFYDLEELAKEVVDHINYRKQENNKFENEYNYLMSKIKVLKK